MPQHGHVSNGMGAGGTTVAVTFSDPASECECECASTWVQRVESHTRTQLWGATMVDEGTGSLWSPLVAVRIVL